MVTTRRVHLWGDDYRHGSGLGEELVRWAIDTARARGCVLVQL
jgi:predicted N-acetyltransferase YhbS